MLKWYMELSFSGLFFPHIHTIEEHYGHTHTHAQTHTNILSLSLYIYISIYIYISLYIYTHTQHRHTGWWFDIFIFLPEMMIKTISRRSTSQMVARIRITTLWYRTFQVGEFEFFSITLWSCILVFADSASVNQDYGKINFQPLLFLVV